MIRAARRMAERVGYDPETGLHSGDLPQIEDSEMIIQDGKDLRIIVKNHSGISSTNVLISVIASVGERTELQASVCFQVCPSVTLRVFFSNCQTP